MARKFNEQQRQAIDLQNHDILVSAAAGSGKTTVLVERVVSKIMNGMCDVDTMLILTFTEAAASEMKQRVQVELDKAIVDCINNQQLERKERLLIQKNKLNDAYISTFHAFCNRILKQYSYLVDIDPSFTLLEEGMIRIIKTKIIEELLETKWLYNDDFIAINSLYFDDLEYQGMIDLIMRVYQMTTGLSQKEEWFNDIKSILTYKEYASSIAYQKIKEDIFLNLHRVEKQYVDLEDIAIKENYTKYDEIGKAEKNVVIQLISYLKDTKDHYDLQRSQIYAIFDGFPSKRMSFPKECDTDRKEVFSNKRKEAKRILKEEIIETFFRYDEETTKKHDQFNVYVINQLEEFINDFTNAYKEYKKERNLLDFNDLEQYTISILEESSNGVCQSLNQLFHEVMIDEYQDTNGVQEYLIDLIVNQENHVNRFMVGDMKQSIYRFRQADPLLFKDKYDQYDSFGTNSKQIKINLGYNYRSGVQVLDNINYIFNQLMDQKLGELEYLNDERARLNFDTNSFSIHKDNDQTYNMEVITLDMTNDTDEEESPEKAELEAVLVANRIQELIQNKYQTKKGKDITYKDIVVLARNTSNFYQFKKVFQEYNIPCYLNTKSGFMASNEIISILSLLTCIYNPYDDISLLAVLRSPYLFSHFDEIELAYIIGKKDSKLSLWDHIQNYTGQYAIKVKQCIDTLLTIKEYVMTHSISQSILYIYQKTGYIEFVLGQKNALQAKANLDVFYEDILSLETNEHFDFYQLVSYYKQLTENKIDKKAAQVASQQDNVVNFMTIHSSKGLEFPIVFLIQTHVRFNNQDNKNMEYMDKEHGIAINYRSRYPLDGFNDVIKESKSNYKKYVGNKIKEKQLSEEMRLLYVALTRAKEKIIITGIEKEEAILTWLQDALTIKDVILPYEVRSANCYLKWIIYSIARHSMIDKENINGKLRELEHESGFTLINKSIDQLQKPILFSIQQDQNINYNDLHQMISFTYPHQNIPYRQSVTQLKEEASTPYKPSLYIKPKEENSGLAANERGTLIHTFLEHLPIDKNVDMKELKNQLVKEKLFNDIENQELEKALPLLEKFKQSDCFEKMLEAKHVYHELPFASLNQKGTLIHGIMDVVCECDDGFYIIDYKSDRVSINDDLHDRYKVQMEYYIEALRKLFPDQKVKAMVYFIEIAKTYYYE